MIKLYGRDWIGSLSYEIGATRDAIRKWRKQGIPKWFLLELPARIDERKQEVKEAEDMALNAIAEARENQRRVRVKVEDL